MSVFYYLVIGNNLPRSTGIENFTAVQRPELSAKAFIAFRQNRSHRLSSTECLSISGVRTLRITDLPS